MYMYNSVKYVTVAIFVKFCVLHYQDNFLHLLDDLCRVIGNITIRLLCSISVFPSPSSSDFFINS